MDVVEVKTRGGLVEDEKRGFAALLAEVVSQFDALVFTARKGGRRLPQFDVAQPHILQRAQAFGHLTGLVGVEKVDGLIDRHVEDVVDVLVVEFHLQHLGFEALTVATLAFQHEVGHKLHLNAHGALALALLAPAAIGIEGEKGGCHLHLFGQRLVGHQAPDFVVGLDVGHGVGARGLADGVLVDEVDSTEGIEIAGEVDVLPGAVGALPEVALQCTVEDIAHKGGLARTRHTGHHGEHIEREVHVDAFQVVVARTDHADGAIPPAARSGDVYPFCPREKVESVALRVGRIYLRGSFFYLRGRIFYLRGRFF